MLMLLLLLQLLHVNANINNFNIETTFAIDFLSFVGGTCTKCLHKFFL